MPTEPVPRRRAVDAGLCTRCTHAQQLSSKTSVFVRCGLSDRDAGFPRYPTLPVANCRGFEPRASDISPQADARR